MAETLINVMHVTDEDTDIIHGITVGEVAQKHVLRSFNVTNDAKVDLTKVLCAAIIQQMLDLRDTPGASAATKRAASIAITQCEAMQMQAVKANFVQA